MRPLALFSPLAVGLTACAIVTGGCSATPTQPTLGAAANPQSALSAAPLPGQAAIVSEAAAAHLNPTELADRGWSCRQPPIPNRIVCSHPNQGFPVQGNPPPADRPANFTLLTFDGAGNFIGTQILLRADLYHGQLCESTGAPYILRPPIGYYECLHTVGQ
jgi:hypothetical protein